MDRTFLVVSIVRNLLGQAGIILFAVVVALACVTTAVGLVSACADYFSGLSGGRVSYRTLVCVICVFSAVVSNFGLNEIIAIASPILSVVYPPTLVLIVLALFGSRIRRDWVFRLAAPGRPGSEPAGGSPHLHRCGAGLSGPAAPGVSGFRLGVARRCLRRSGRPDPRRPDCRLLMPYFHFSHTGGLIV